MAKAKPQNTFKFVLLHLKKKIKVIINECIKKRLELCVKPQNFYLGASSGIGPVQYQTNMNESVLPASARRPRGFGFTDEQV